MTKERLEHQIIRTKNQIKELEDKQEHLSKHGYWDLGYWKGRLTLQKKKRMRKCYPMRRKNMILM